MLTRLLKVRKTVLLALVLFGWSGLYSHIAYGDIVSTHTLIEQAKGASVQEKLQNALGRDDVVAMLEANGVSKAMAQERVSALTEAEANQLAAKFDELPAGGNVTLLLVIIILILLLR